MGHPVHAVGSNCLEITYKLFELPYKKGHLNILLGVKYLKNRTSFMDVPLGILYQDSDLTHFS